jgi:hypothetical protein
MKNYDVFITARMKLNVEADDDWLAKEDAWDLIYEKLFPEYTQYIELIGSKVEEL